MKGVYVFFADGFEDTEAIATVDMLVRGGVPVRTVSIYDRKTVKSSHGIEMTVSMDFKEFQSSVVLSGTSQEDFMVFPGGLPGAHNLAGCDVLMSLMKKHYEEGGSVAAICASPSVVLSLLPGIEGKTMTCYDGFEPALIDKGVKYSKDGVVVDGRIITGRGAGHTIAFGLAIVAKVKGQETADAVGAAIML